MVVATEAVVGPFAVAVVVSVAAALVVEAGAPCPRLDSGDWFRRFCRGRESKRGHERLGVDE